jgi:hypothetical protein
MQPVKKEKNGNYITSFKRGNKENESEIYGTFTITKQDLCSLSILLCTTNVFSLHVNSTWLKCPICCHKPTLEWGPTKDILQNSFEDLNQSKPPLIISYHHIWFLFYQNPFVKSTPFPSPLFQQKTPLKNITSVIRMSIFTCLCSLLFQVSIKWSAEMQLGVI